ncbi:MAG: VWA domain-containing protein [Deltaproteobacteria bacterium]|nr:VWA domain-containing protein [Deltaproteobacteria bacterium]
MRRADFTIRSQIQRLALLLTLFGSASARADTIATARGEPIVEVAHEVAVEIERGLARLRVRRTFENRGQQPDQVETEFSLPEGAVATGMRIKGKRQWYQGQLLEAEMARVAYESLTGYGPWDLKDPAILFWNDQGRLGLFVFPVSPGTRSLVEYTLLVPLAYRNGSYFFSYPTQIDQVEMAMPDAVLRNGHRSTRFWINGVSVANGEKTALGRRLLAGESEQDSAIDDADVASLGDVDELFEDADESLLPDQRRPGSALIAVSAPPIDVLDVRLGRFDLSADKHLTWLDVDAAYPLRPAPRRAQVVFAIDASRSLGSEGIEAALEFASAFVAQLPDGSFEVVAFNRRAQRLFGRFVGASEWPRELAAARTRAALTPQNGSFLERGLQASAAALSPRTGPRRIVAITDALLRSAYRNAASGRALAALSGDRVVHVVDLEPGSAGDEVSAGRDDEHALAPVPLNHGGILYAVAGGACARDYQRSALELVRPTRIDGFRVVTEDGVERAIGAPAALREGVGLRHASLQAARVSHVTLQGRIWAEPFVRVVPIDASFSGEVLPALLFGTDLHSGLERVELLRAAIAGRAVSPVTSYLSVEPGTRPSREGFEPESGGMSGFGSGGGGFGGKAGLGVNIVQGAVDRQALLTELAQRAAAPCLARWPLAEPLAIEVECTYAEIVDLLVDDWPARELLACVEEALWAIALPPAFSEERDQFSIAIE